MDIEAMSLVVGIYIIIHHRLISLSVELEQTRDLRAKKHYDAGVSLIQHPWLTAVYVINQQSIYSEYSALFTVWRRR